MGGEVYRDAWGIPHLRAGNAAELAHLQGRNAAADRAWQIEVERHRAQGTTAAFLGPDAVDWDRFARRALLDDTARRCHRALDPATAAWVGAYADGVNAGLAEGAARAPEFAAAGLRPGRWHPWTPLALWLSAHILFAGFPAKLWRDAVARRLGADAVPHFATDGPGTAGSNGWLVTGDRTAGGGALLAGDPHRFIEEPGVYQQIHLACPEFDVVGLAVPGVPGIAHFGHTGGVAWSITHAMADYQDLYRERLRRRDHGGEPVVEALGPDGWRPVELSRTETIEVAGAAPVSCEVIETARGPVVIGGVNDSGLHAAGLDAARLHAAGLEGAWLDAALPQAAGPEGARREGARLHAAGQSNAWLDDPGLFGPRPDGPGQGNAWPDGPEPDGPGTVGTATAVSLRCPARVSGALGFAALPALLRATTVADVDRAMDRWVEPVNVVQAADTRGGVLHRVAGLVPVRHRDNGLRVVPAWEPGHAWRGWHTPLPRAAVTDGLAVMANERGFAAPLGVEFAAPHRARRIRRLLAGSATWTAKDMAAVHTDTRLDSAATLLDLVAALPGPLSDDAARLRERLLRWDRRMAADSADAAAYATLRAEVVRAVAARPELTALATGMDRPGGDGAVCPDLFLPWLALLPRVAFALESLLTGGPLPAAALPGLVAAALEKVAPDCREQAPWGELHRLAPWRALPPDGPAAEPGLAGDHDCVLSTSSVPGVTHHSPRGPAARYVWDLADRAESRWIVPFGASGVPGTPHHRDQLPLWLRGDLVPVVTDWALLRQEHHDQ